MKVTKIIDALATMPVAGVRFKWGRKSKVPKNIRRKIRYRFNKLDLENKLSEAYRNFMVYGEHQIRS